MGSEIDVSIILPCRNEEKSIGNCIEQIKEVIKLNKLKAEIIVSDSSKDNSSKIAKKLNSKVIKHDKKGYGIAYQEAFKEAKGKYLFMADCDGTYDFRNIPNFINYLKKGYDFVIGNRFEGKITSMPFLHKHIGNPFLTLILKLFFKSKIKDSHCGMRAIKKESLGKLELKTTGMEFASEMIVKALKNNLKIKETPINYHKRTGNSKLKSFSDGWRHLRFMLMYAPNYLFMIPGLLLMLMGTVIMITLMMGPVKILNFTFYNHPIIIGSFFMILGYQILNLGLYSKTYAISTGFEKNDKLVDLLAKHVNFESGIMVGFFVMLVSIILGLIIVINWIKSGYSNLFEINKMTFILTLAVLGVQTIFSALFLSILLVEKK